MKSEKESKVLDAAEVVFMRYGFRRVTMHDIASEANMSRPALYLTFCNKEDIFKAAILRRARRHLAEIREGVNDLPTTEEKLKFAFEVWSVRGFELMSTMPDAKELFSCTLEFAGDMIQQLSADFEQQVASTLEPVVASAERQPLTATQIAHLLNTSVHGFKETASSVSELRVMIHGMIGLILGGLATAPMNANSTAKQ